MSPRAIAAALNREGIPSAGSNRKRVDPRPRPWMPSAIAGDPSRGSGILNNEVYSDSRGRAPIAKRPRVRKRVALRVDTPGSVEVDHQRRLTLRNV